MNDYILEAIMDYINEYDPYEISSSSLIIFNEGPAKDISDSICKKIAVEDFSKTILEILTRINQFPL